MGENVLEVRGLAKRYGDVEALKGIDLSVERGAVFGFLGPNGSGKTTTIRIVAGLVKATSGTVLVHGHDVRREWLSASRGLRTLVEVPAFYPGLSGETNLSIFARLCGSNGREVATLLDRVGLASAKDRRVGGYSLGMKQRLGIAQALLGRPSLVVLDEPMNGLDPAGMHEMRALIREENRERGTTFVVSSHQLDDVQRLCDRIGVLHRGRLVAEGRIADLLSQAISGFRVRCDRPEAAMESLGRALPESAPAREPDGHIHVRGDASILGRLHRALLDANAPAVEVLPVRASLERYFLDLTEGEMG